MEKNVRHEVFKRCLEFGYRWQRYVAEFLSINGIDVRVPDLEVRFDPSTKPFDRDFGDIWAGEILIEVKSTFYGFTSPMDFPQVSPIVDSVSSFDRKKPQRPDAVVVVSRRTGAMIALSVEETFGKWRIHKRWDSVTEQTREFYFCPRILWVPIEQLVDALKERSKA